MSYVDPSTSDERFPDRPTHEDFKRLSDTVQGIDLRAEAGASIPEITPLDRESLDYFIANRLGVLGNALGIDLIRSPLIAAIYLEGLAVGTLAERAR